MSLTNASVTIKLPTPNSEEPFEEGNGSVVVDADLPGVVKSASGFFTEDGSSGEPVVTPSALLACKENWKRMRLAKWGTDDEVYVPSWDKMPYYDWSYGCAPTAAAMILGWVEKRWETFGRLVDWHFQRWDPVETDSDYQVPNAQRELAIWMNTDTQPPPGHHGGTRSDSTKPGILAVANSLNGYSFQVVENYGNASNQWAWGACTTAIKVGGVAFSWGLDHYSPAWGHRMAAIAYRTSPSQQVLVHTTWRSTPLEWWDNGYTPNGDADQVEVDAVYPNGGGSYPATYVTTPLGDTTYDGNGHGEVWYSSQTQTLRWDNFNSPGDSIVVAISYDGGVTWYRVGMVPDNGAYSTYVPSGWETEAARLRILQYKQGSYVAGDGSFGNFIIRAPPSQPNISVDSSSIHCTLNQNSTGYNYFHISNTGNATLHVSSITDDANWLSENPTSCNISPGNSQTITSTFNSSGLSPGDYYGTITISSDDPNHPTVYVTAYLHVNGSTPEPNISVDSSSIHCTLDQNSTGYNYFDISNTGNATLHVSSITDDVSWLSENPTSCNISPGNSQTITSTFNSSGVGPGDYTGTITISSDDPNHPTVNVTAYLHVNSSGGGSRQHAIPLTSGVKVTTTVDTVYKYGQFAQWWNVVGLRTSTDWDMTTYDIDFSSARASSAQGTGVPDFCVSDCNHSPADSMGVRVYNYGGSGGSADVQYRCDTAVLTPNVVNGPFTWNAGDVVRVWDITLSSSSYHSYDLNITSGSPDLGFALFKSNGTTYYAGRDAAVALADNNGAGGNENFSYTASGSNDYYGLVVFAKNSNSGTFTIKPAYNPTTPQPSIRVSPMSMSATLAPNQTTTQTLTIYNDGTATLTVSSITDSATWLSENPTSGNVSPGGSLPITVTYNSSGLSQNTYYTSIVVRSNDPNHATTRVTVQLTVRSAPAAPTPISPANGAQLSTTTPQLVVQQVSGADMYHFKVKEGSALIREGWPNTNYWTVSPALAYGHSYTWTCQVHSSGGWSAGLPPL